jgi:DNA polymerase III subunit delta
MKLVRQTLSQALAQPLAPLWLVAGTEPLLIGECAEEIRSAARRQGVTDREVHFADRGFDWSALRGLTQSMSLFGDRRLIELKLGAKPGAEGAKTLIELLESPPTDVVVLVVTEALDWSERSASWIQQFEAKGVYVDVAAPTVEQLPGWVAGRLRSAGVAAGQDVAELISARCEGNLLAAHQEIERLALLAAGREIDLEQATEWVGNSARYGVFQLGEAVLAGDATRSLRILAGLEAEGEEATLVLWTLAEELRTLLQWTPRAGKGSPGRLWRGGRRRQELVAQAARRLPRERVQALLESAGRVDLIIKGVRRGHPWDALATIAAAIAGAGAAVALP